MSTGPGTIKRIVNIDLPRPRRVSDTRNSIDFNRINGVVWNLLHDIDVPEEKTGLSKGKAYDEIIETQSGKTNFDSAAL
jgi:NitT/TauT family transport system ATP-binding protein